MQKNKQFPFSSKNLKRIRISLLDGRYLLLLLLICLFASTSTGATKEHIELKAKKQSIILNIAADAIVGYPKWGNIDTISREHAIKAIKDYVGLYANTEVSCLLFNINYQRSCFDSKIMESYWNLKNPDSSVNGWPVNHWKIYKKGIDVYDVAISQTRDIGMSPWLSFRMNDHHYFNDSTRINTLWWNHPELRLSQSAMFNYAKKEVREYYKAYIREALEKYDVDGIELDWMRTNTLFKKGEEKQGIGLINQFMEEIRQLTEEAAKKRNHPVLIAARVPATPAIARSFGLDGVAWAKNGWVDVLVPTNWYVPTNFDIPVERWKQEIGKHADYILAPCADFAYRVANDKYLKMIKSNVETMRGFCTSAYHRGADAIYLFNNFDPSYNRKTVSPDGTVTVINDKQIILRETGKPSTMTGKPRTHVYTYNDPDTIPVREKMPVLQKDIKAEFKIYTGPKPAKGRYIVRIGIDSSPGFKDADFQVKLNGQICRQTKDMYTDPAYKYDNTKKWEVLNTTSETGARVMQFNADLSAVKSGYNQISIVNTQNEEQSVTWLEVHID